MTTPTTRFDKESSLQFSDSSPGAKLLLSIFTGGDGKRHLQSCTTVATQDGNVVHHYDLSKLNFEEASEFVDLDDFAAELEDTGAPVKDARRWVANEFYSGSTTLAALRLRGGLSQKELAAMCGMEQPHMSRYESGKTEPSLSIAMKMATALNVSLDEFASAWECTKVSVEKEKQ